MNTSQLTLVSHTLCPYVQRAAIVLAEKEIPFDRQYVDLSDPPEWFVTRSPLGRVPLLIVDGQVLFESAVIVEYLDEVTAGSLHPEEPMEKARHRAWMEFGSAILDNIGRLYSARTEQAYMTQRHDLMQRFSRLERELGSGPYFSGEAFRIVDAVFGPIFRYFDLFEQYWTEGLFTGLVKLTAWRSALAARPSVRHAVRSDYADELNRFVLDRGSYLSDLAQRVSPVA